MTSTTRRHGSFYQTVSAERAGLVLLSMAAFVIQTLAVSPLFAEAKQPPNILMILVDDK